MTNANLFGMYKQTLLAILGFLLYPENAVE